MSTEKAGIFHLGNADAPIWTIRLFSCRDLPQFVTRCLPAGVCVFCERQQGKCCLRYPADETSPHAFLGTKKEPEIGVSGSLGGAQKER